MKLSSQSTVKEFEMNVPCMCVLQMGKHAKALFCQNGRVLNLVIARSIKWITSIRGFLRQHCTNVANEEQISFVFDELKNQQSSKQ